MPVNINARIKQAKNIGKCKCGAEFDGKDVAFALALSYSGLCPDCEFKKNSEEYEISIRIRQCTNDQCANYNSSFESRCWKFVNIANCRLLNQIGARDE